MSILHQDQADSPSLELCRRYAVYHDAKAGESAVQYLRSHGSALHAETAVECLKLVLQANPAGLSSSQDIIIAELARQSHDVRLYMAMELEGSATEFFDNLYERGDQAANCLRVIVLDSSLWLEESARLRVEDDLFQLFLAKLMESGHDLDGRALKGIALLLMADASRLSQFIDEEGFEALLTSLDIQLPNDVRGQATLVISKYLEMSEATGQKYLSNFVTAKVKKQKANDFILAFSAAAGLFPVATTVTAPLFLTEGFLASLLPLLDRKLNNSVVHDAFLALLNAACIDGACRAAVAKYCTPWLSHKVSNGTDKQNALAATILAKLRTAGGNMTQEQKVSNQDDDVSELVDLFTTNLRVETSAQNVSNSIEGLAYTSLKSGVKEKLAQDAAFLKALLQTLDTNTTVPEIVIGGLSIVSNLTQYPPNLSEEQKKISQLKAYANASKPSAPSLLENESHVSARCTAIVNAGIMPSLVRVNKASSNSATQLIDKILLSLSRNPKDRGKIAQQGAVKLLISHTQKAAKSPELASSTYTEAAHALARILISLDPSHVFPSSGTPHITDAVIPLAFLLKPPENNGPVLSDQPRDLLPVFESLLALTNLASSPDQTAATAIVRTAWDTTEDLLLSNNPMLRRASCELVCNLSVLPAGVEKFIDAERGNGKRRVHLLLALSDVDDTKTRLASSGALAMLTEYAEIVLAVLKVTRFAEIILGLCEDQDQGLVHRGLVILNNLLQTEDEKQSAREKLKAAGGVEVMKEVLKRTKDQGILQLGVEALKILV